VKMLRRALRRDVRARIGQFAAIWATVVLGVALFAASYDAFGNLTASYRGMYDDLAFADIWATSGDPAGVASAMGAVPGVEATDTRSVGEVPVKVGSHDQLARLVGLPDGREPDVNRVMLLRGSQIEAGRDDQVLAEQHLGWEPGTTVRVLAADGWRTATVVGVVASPEYLWPARSRQEVLVPWDQWGVLFAPEALVTSLPPGTVHGEAMARLAPDAPDGTLAEVRAAAVSAGAISTMSRDEQPSNAALREDLDGFGEMSVAFPALFLLAGALALAILLGRMVATQRVQIGVLTANGLSRRQVLLHYLGFGVAVGVAGSVPGVILGGLLAAAVSRLYTAAISVPVTVVQVRPTTIIAGLVIGIAAAAAAAFVPARRAAATAPAEAMRGTGPAGRGGLSLAERLLPPLRRLPARWRFALRAPGRNPRRTLSTVIGVALAATLILVSAGMIDTVQILLDRQFRVVQREDAAVGLAEPVAASDVARILAAPGVARAEPGLTVPAAIVHGDRRYATSVVGFEPGTTMHGFRAPGGDLVELPAEGLMLGTAMRDLLDVGVGDMVTVVATDGGGRADLTVAGFVDEPFGTYAYASLASVAPLAGQPASDPMVATGYVQYEAGADPAAVAAGLSALPEVAAVVDTRALYAMAQDLMGLFYAFVGLALVFGGVIAFAVVFTTMNANIAERTPELAALRTLGMSRRSVSWLVTAENMALTTIGLVPGLVVGYAAAAVFMASFSSDLFQFGLEVRPTTFVLTAAVILVVGLASQVPALRGIARIDLAKVVRERAT
jgi:putative ABC transport system permease protein